MEVSPEFRREAYDKRTSVRRPSDMSKGDHLAIIVFGSIYIPGDERSRTNPGHGYPASTETTLSYYVWAVEDREYWEYEIAQHEKSRDNYVALDRGKKVSVEPTFKIS